MNIERVQINAISRLLRVSWYHVLCSVSSMPKLYPGAFLPIEEVRALGGIMEGAPHLLLGRRRSDGRRRRRRSDVRRRRRGSGRFVARRGALYPPSAACPLIWLIETAKCIGKSGDISLGELPCMLLLRSNEPKK